MTYRILQQRIAPDESRWRIFVRRPGGWRRAFVPQVCGLAVHRHDAANVREVPVPEASELSSRAEAMTAVEAHWHRSGGRGAPPVEVLES